MDFALDVFAIYTQHIEVGKAASHHGKIALLAEYFGTIGLIKSILNDLMEKLGHKASSSKPQVDRHNSSGEDPSYEGSSEEDKEENT